MAAIFRMGAAPPCTPRSRRNAEVPSLGVYQNHPTGGPLDTPDRGPATAACPTCGGHPRWESVLDGDEERWLSTCRCGRMRAFLPEQPSLDPADPLRAFLLGVGRPIFPPTPPWIRLFLASLEG